ncbi:MAG: translation initiation factor IF-2 [Candidatus Sungbacteria bacterium]|nr:translation initiation factor IF-2 [Candidatus Sungbacteria bacterium]
MQKKVGTKENKQNFIRPPIVVVMGHVDHGKTTILDWYRKTKVAEGETGGITQHIGAYQINVGNPPSSKTTAGQRKITFIDTPGHEAFSKLRSRGARAADIAILVVAADDGVKPQTKEAIQIIRENGLTFAVAINKVDKPGANVERVKQELAKEEILVEGYGGNVPSVAISAKTGEHMDDLLEVILLLAELEELASDPQKNAEGIVVEAHMDPRRGVTATLLVLDGTLKKQNVLAVGRAVETMKIFEDFLGNPIETAGPSSPVRTIGFAGVPTSGDKWFAFGTQGEAEKIVASLPAEESKKNASAASSPEKIVFNLILKTDVFGSKEALEDALAKFGTDEVVLKILKSEVGDINESDVKLAMATKLVTIVGFKVKIDPAVRTLADNAKIRIISGGIIYELLDMVKEKISEMLPPEIRRMDLGRVKILKLFKKDGNKQIIGGRVDDGRIKKGVLFEVKRLKEGVGRGTLLDLQQNKISTSEVIKGLECGMSVDSATTIEPGDVLEIYEEEVIKRTL